MSYTPYTLTPLTERNSGLVGGIAPGTDMAYAPAVHKNRSNVLNLRESVPMVEDRAVMKGRQFESYRLPTQMFIENGQFF